MTMPDMTIEITDADMALLDRVCARIGLDGIEQAAEWLIRARLRRTAHRVARGSALLYLVPKELRKPAKDTP
jgi:hypothetical protein